MITIAKQVNNKWLAFYRPKPLARISLFCFPYAGSGPVVFQSWAQRVPETIGVLPVQLPGRGSRLAEPRFTNIRPLVEAVAEGLRPHFVRPFAFFGHSMGALVSFELARLLRRNGQTQPTHLFVSGCNAPQLPLTRRPIYNLPADEFLEELRGMNGTAPEVLEHSELMQLMLPIIRDDFTVCQTYSYSPEPWLEQTSSKFSMEMIVGDHFFIHSALPRVLRTIAATL